MLHRAGVSVGICGTLHSFPVPDDIADYSFYLPDSFATEPTAFPQELAAFQEFNLTMVRASSRNVDTGIPKAAALRFLRSTPKIGIRPQTFAVLAGQLALERRKPWLSTRRRSYQSIFAFDLFAKQLAQRRPAFSSFFTNHVASAMHRYWAAGHPGDYDQLNLGDEWMARYRDEVPWAMQRVDDMLGRLVAFADTNPEYQLWVASSMGQGPTFAQPLETQLYLQDPAMFLQALGAVPADGWSRRPAMLPAVQPADRGEYADAFEAALRDITVGGAALAYRRAELGFFSLQWGQPNLHDRPDAVRIAGTVRSPDSLGLQIVEIEEQSDTTAYHVPHGVLAIYDPQDRKPKSVPRKEVSVLEIAPAILANFGVAQPHYMQEPASLVTTRSAPVSASLP